MAAAAEGRGELYQGVERDGRGFKLLQTMGWSEGRGLGANEDGIATHVRVKKRRELTGIGADVTENSKFNWTVNTQAFDAVLANLNSAYGQTKNSGSEKSDEEAAEDAEPEGEGKLSKKERKEQKKKRKDARAAKRQKKIEEKAKEEESSSEEEDVAPRVVRLRPQGRYAKRELSKNVASYSSQDLAALLGVVPTFQAPTAAIAVNGKITGCDSDSDSDSDGKQTKAKRAKVKRCLIVIEAPQEKAVELDEETKARHEAFFKLDPNWWGAAMFRSAGVLGSKKVDDAEDDEGEGEGEEDKDTKFDEKKRGFSEADQERLYFATHGGATSGRKGLGIADRKRKVAGAHWEGSKKAFGDSESDEETGNEELEVGGESKGKTKTKVSKSKSGVSLEESNRASRTSKSKSCPSFDALTANIKWKKATEAVLNESAGKLRVSKLVKRVLAHVIEADSKSAESGMLRAASKDDLKDHLLTKLRQSSRFQVCEEFVQFSVSEEPKQGSSNEIVAKKLTKKASKDNLKR
mmetsp:Transcript_24839/g.41515  ORF Transcript_24839/g.41515 Transcript_24839/m.41515 type:complete len:521 (+) Transcript_24839:65-1627(+)